LSDTGVLLYCISNVENPKGDEISGLDENYSIFSIEDQGIYGIVSEVSQQEYGEENFHSKGEDVEWLTEKARKYMDIILAVSRNATVIPMKFITIFKSIDRVKEIIRENMDLFTDKLNMLVGKEEHSIKIYCNEKVFKQTSMEDEIKAFEESIVGKPKGTAFFLRKKFDQELKEIVQEKVCKVANSMIDGASTLFEGMKSNKLLAKEMTGVQDKMILNIALLLQIDQKEELYRYIHTVKEHHEKNGFSVQISGPWPPFSFCSINREQG